MTTAVIIIEAILALLIVIFAISGGVNGFIKTVLSLVSAVAAVLAGIYSGRFVSEFVFSKMVRQPLIDNLSSQIYEKVQSGSPIKLFLGMQNLFSVDSSAVTTQEQALSLGTRLVDGTIGPVITGIIKVVVFVIVFLIVMAILNAIAKKSKKINKESFVGGLNRFLGAVLGILLGVVACFVLVTVFQYLITSFGEVFNFVTPEDLDKSFIYKTLANFKISEWFQTTTTVS